MTLCRPFSLAVAAAILFAAQSAAQSPSGYKPDKFKVLENVATQRDARTMALDEKTHRIFLATADLRPPPPATAEQPHPRPSVVPDSFTILVLAR